MPIEARDYSQSITQLAANPPAYPRNVAHKPLDSLSLYIVRVPGSRDVFLSPLKPGNKDSTVESLKQALYYLHVSTPEDEGFVRQAMAEGVPELEPANAGANGTGADASVPYGPFGDESQRAMPAERGGANDHQRPGLLRDPPVGRSVSVRSTLSESERQRLNFARRKPLPGDDSASMKSTTTSGGGGGGGDGTAKRSSSANPNAVSDRPNPRHSLGHRRSASIGFDLSPAAKNKPDQGTLDEPLDVLPPPPSAPAHKTGFYSSSSSSVESASSSGPNKAKSPPQRSQFTRESVLSGNENWKPIEKDKLNYKPPTGTIPYRPAAAAPPRNPETLNSNSPPEHRPSPPLSPPPPSLPSRQDYKPFSPGQHDRNEDGSLASPKPAGPPPPLQQQQAEGARKPLPGQPKGTPISSTTTVNFGSPYQPESEDQQPPKRSSQDELPKPPPHMPPQLPPRHEQPPKERPTGPLPPLPPRPSQFTRQCLPSPYVPNPFNLTLIRRDPVSGSQWNVGTINYPTALATNPAATCENGHMHDVQDTSSMDIEILTPGYKRLLKSPAILASTVGGMTAADIAALPPAMREAVEKMTKNAGIKNPTPPPPAPSASASGPQQQPQRFIRRIRLVHRDGNHHHHSQSHGGNPTTSNSRPHRSLRESMNNIISNVFQTQIPSFGPAATVASGGIVGLEVPVTPGGSGGGGATGSGNSDGRSNSRESYSHSQYHNRAAQESRRTSLHRSRSPRGRSGSGTGLMGPPPPPPPPPPPSSHTHTTTAHSHNSGPSWYTFTSPWGGMCAFMPSANGHSIKLRHAIVPQGASTSSGQGGGNNAAGGADGSGSGGSEQECDHHHHPPPPESATATAAEIRFNLPFLSSGPNPSSAAPAATSQHSKRASVSLAPGDVTNNPAAATPASLTMTQGQGQGSGSTATTTATGTPASAIVGGAIAASNPHAVPPPSPSPSPAPAQAHAPTLPAVDEREGRRRQRRRYSRPRSLSRASARLSALFSHSHANPSADDDGNDGGGGEQQPQQTQPQQPQQQIQQKPPEPQEQTTTTTDTLNLAREKPGGGMRGRSAKLGKLVIEDEGLKMVDLVVSACMAVWWRGYEGSVR